MTNMNRLSICSSCHLSFSVMEVSETKSVSSAMGDYLHDELHMIRMTSDVVLLSLVDLFLFGDKNPKTRISLVQTTYIYKWKLLI